MSGGAQAGNASQLLPIAVTAQVQSAFGPQHVVFTGWTQIEAGQPRDENGIDVFDIKMTQLHLAGASQIGALSVALQETPDSVGEVRATQSGAQFPASSFLDLYAQISAADSPLGALVFHNESALHIVPWSGDGETSITAWPPMGTEYRLQTAGAGCVPLIQQGGEPYDLGLCVDDLRLDIAPALPTFSVGRGGPSRLHPADLLGIAPGSSPAEGQAPFVRIHCASLGLTADGCDDGSDGTQDDVTGLSFGDDMMGPGPPSIQFSPAPGAEGAPDTAVRQQHDCPPAAPGQAPEAESDIFASGLSGENTQLFDGNGPIGTCPGAFPLGLLEAATVRDNVDALDMHDASLVDADGDGVPDVPVYFSLDADSPSLNALGFTASDILMTQGGGPPSAFASSGQLGLRPGDEISAFCLKEDGDHAYDAGDVIYFALTPRSPSLAAVGAGPGDILSPGSPLQLVARGSALGLADTDALGALSCETLLSLQGVLGDVNCDGAVNGIDAEIVLHYEARLIAAVPCPENSDANSDGMINSIDALLILQVNAGLMDRLP